MPPPANLPSEWADYIHPNCFQNIERLGRWIGGTQLVGLKESPEKYFSPVNPQSIGSNNSQGVDLYVVTHGWAPGLRQAVNKAEGKLQWWSADAIRSDTGMWGSNWAWCGTKGEKHDLEVSPTGLFQQIEINAAQVKSTRETIILAYSWIDDSGTLPMGIKELLVASRSEAYTNLNGLRLAAAIADATTPDFFENPNNKIHIIGHSHGTKVATIASLNLQSKGKQIDHLTILDPAENELCLISNVANLLGYYFERMKIAEPSQIGRSGFTFVDNYVSFFGMGLAGPDGSSINNIRQIGLESGHVFKIANFSQRHAYAASWYSNAQSASLANQLAVKGLGWPPVLPNPNSNYYQKFEFLPRESYLKEQWTLHEGKLKEAGAKTIVVTNPSIEINKVSSSGEVSGTAATQLDFTFKNGLEAVPASFVGKFDARIKDLKGISFELEWNNPRPNEFIVVTVESPIEELNPRNQVIAMVLDASAFKKTGNANGVWHPVSFNTFSIFRPTTEFAIHYFPGRTWKGQYGAVRIKNFGYVKEASV